jgi:hypothetical protein
MLSHFYAVSNGGKTCRWLQVYTVQGIQTMPWTSYRVRFAVKDQEQEQSVPDPWHFGTDPDPRIRTFD